jgi:hypothetical protein
MLHTQEHQTPALLHLRGRVGVTKKSGFHVFESPGGDVLLNITAASILNLCDGTRTRQQIGSVLARTRPDYRFAEYVQEFLDAATQRGWICEEKYSHIGRGESREEFPMMSDTIDSGDVARAPIPRSTLRD